jgi:hypothetical protein
VWKLHINYYRSDAKKPAKGGLLSGSGRTGWTVTQAGLKWALEAVQRLADKDLTRKREQSRAGSIDENRWRRERARIQSTTAWTYWVQGKQELSRREAAEVFRIDSYAVGQMKEAKITRLLAMFDGDREIGPFLHRMATLLEQNDSICGSQSHFSRRA